MFNRIRILSLALVCALPLPAFAFTVGVLGKPSVDTFQKTYVVISGFGKEMHGAFFEAAATKAMLLHRAFPKDQVILVRALDNAHYDWGDRDDHPEYSDEEGLKMDADEMTELGFNIVMNDDEDMDSDVLIEYLAKFHRIGGIDVYSHFAPYMGARTSTGGGRAGLRFATDDMDTMKALRGHFTQGAYMALHGCNSGWVNAGRVSKYLKIAVMGSLTATDLQYLAADGEWYFNDPARWPTGMKKAKMQKFADGTTAKCPPSDGCTRLKPINTVYQGHAGKVEGGQPFYKFFCKYSSDLNGDGDCHRAMAQFLLGWPSSNVKPVTIASPIEDLKVVALDYLCPSSKLKTGDSIRVKCVNAILASEISGNEVYSPFNGNPTACDMRKCFAKLDKQNVLFWDTGGDVLSPPNPADRTIIQEYKRLMHGFELLKVRAFN